MNGFAGSADIPVLNLVETAPVDAPTRFDALFQALYPPVHALVHRVLGDPMATDDIVQDSFLKLSAQPDLQARPDPEVAAWLRRVALNLAFNRLRSERRSRQRLELAARLQSPLDETTAPAAQVVKREEQAAVRRALAELPARQRECLILRHSGYSYTEIAATLDIAVGSVGVLLARAERAFRASFGRQSAS